jgi:hypothetical protein
MTVIVFLSHRGVEDEHDFAIRLATKLAGKSDISVILDEYSLKIGDHIVEWMRKKVRRSDVFAFILSPASLRSWNCKFELARAREFGKPIVPLILKEVERVPKWLLKLKAMDFKDHKDLPCPMVSKLAADIRHQAGRTRSADLVRRPAIVVSVQRGPLHITSWVDHIPPPVGEATHSSSFIRARITNASTMPVEHRLSMRVVGKGIRIGPTRDLELLLLEAITFERRNPPNASAEVISSSLVISSEYPSGTARMVLDIFYRLVGASSWTSASSVEVPVITRWNAHGAESLGVRSTTG